jgi:hypothetical protein
MPHLYNAIKVGFFMLHENSGGPRLYSCIFRLKLKHDYLAETTLPKIIIVIQRLNKNEKI